MVRVPGSNNHFVFLMIIFALQGTEVLAVARSPQAVPFFRSPQSPFASGQLPRLELEKRLKGQEFHHTFKVSWNHKEFWLEGRQLMQEINCASVAQLLENSQHFESNLSTSKSLGLLTKDQDVEIVSLSGYWAEVKNPRTQKIGWVPQSKLKIKNEDAGVFVSLVDTYIRKKPSHDSEIVTTVPRAQRLKIIGYDNGFLKTQYLDHQGYVDLSLLVSRADFAVWAYHGDDKWQLVSHRENQYLITKDGKKIPLEEINSMIGNPTKAVVSSAETSEPPVRAHIEILQTDSYQWGLSQIPGHGLVWWKKDSAQATPAKPEPAVVITTEELLKRQVFSLALEGSKQVKGLVSAQGIYKTEDGIHWTQLKQFGNQDLPVSVHPDGFWFVGSYQSSDRGETFEPFIRWDQLAEMIENHLGRHPRQIRLQKLEALPKGQMQLMVDTGSGHVQLRYHILNSSWSVVK
jgi:hypothetical protein